MASSCLCGSLFLGRLNTLSLSLGETLCMPSMRPIIRRLFYSNQTSTHQLHHTPDAFKEEMKKRQRPYRHSATFQASSPGWQLTSLLLPPSLTDDIICTRTERPGSFQAQFISFYGCSNAVFPKKKLEATGKHTPKSTEALRTSSKAAMCQETYQE